MRFGPLDMLTCIEEGRGYDDLLQDTIEIKFRGQKVRILSLKTLVELKQKSRDPKERQRLPILQETLRQSNANNKQDSCHEVVVLWDYYINKVSRCLNPAVTVTISNLKTC
jgi:predicted nucleotidyltransferase